jgi:hypothetical protein
MAGKMPKSFFNRGYDHAKRYPGRDPFDEADQVFECQVPGPTKIQRDWWIDGYFAEKKFRGKGMNA